MRGSRLAAVLVALVALSAAESSRTADATTFNPQFSSPVTFSDTTPGGHPDVTIGFDILPPSALGGAVTFADPSLTTASDSEIPNTGAYIGQLSAVARLGLTNEGCMTDSPVDFDLVDANANVLARPFTNMGPMTVGAGGIPAASDDALTDFTYVHPLNPLGLAQGTDGPGLGGPVEGTLLAGVNEIRIDSEEMLVVGVDNPSKQYRVVRGWNGTTPAAHSAGATVSRVNVIYPNGPSTNLVANLGEDDGDLDNNGVPEEAAGPGGGPQTNGNQVADGADSVPVWVRDSLDPNGDADDGGAVIAHARYFGMSVVASLLVIPVNIVVLAPGALSAFPNQAWMTAAWGSPSVIVLGDPDAPPSNNGITDLCGLSSDSTIFGIPHDNSCTGAAPPAQCTSSFGGATMKGAVDGGCPAAAPSNPNECGLAGQPNGICPSETCPRVTNPTLGETPKTLTSRVYSGSERDYDGDGIANSLDVCATSANGTWNPYTFNFLSGQDADGDGLPDPCDPSPGVSNSDEDGDGWSNRIDNCPNTPNAGEPQPSPNTAQRDEDVPRGVPVGDGGPRNDGIGDACDIATNSCAGCSTLTPAGPNGHYHATAIVSEVCIGGPADDSDSDGVCNADDCAGVETDCDDDGVGDRLDNCLGGLNSPPPGFAQSQRDLNADTFSDITDISLLTGAFGAEGGNPSNDGVGDSGPPGYQGRLDLNFDSFVDISDISLMTGVFGTSCV